MVILAMANGIRTGDPRGFNKGRSSKFREGSRVRQTPEEGRRTYRPKRWANNNKDEDNSPKNLNDKNQQASSQKFRHLKVTFLENRITCLITKFQKKEGNLWTYTYPNNAKEQIDYRLTNKKWINNALNWEAYSSFEEESSDHKIDRAKISLSLHTNETPKAIITHND